MEYNKVAIATSIIENLLSNVVAGKDPTSGTRCLPVVPKFRISDQRKKRSLETNAICPVDEDGAVAVLSTGEQHLPSFNIESQRKLKKDPGDDLMLARLKGSLQYVTTERDHWQSHCEILQTKMERLMEENNNFLKIIADLEEHASEQSSVCVTFSTMMLETIWSLTENTTISESLRDFQVGRLMSFIETVLRQSLQRSSTVSKNAIQKSKVKLIIAAMGVLVNLTAGKLSAVHEIEDGNDLPQLVFELMTENTSCPRLGCLAVMFFHNLALAEASTSIIISEEVSSIIRYWASCHSLGFARRTELAKRFINLMDQRSQSSSTCKEKEDVNVSQGFVKGQTIKIGTKELDPEQ